MPLDRIAASVQKATPTAFLSDQLCARFHNLIQSLKLGHVAEENVRLRLAYLDKQFFIDPRSNRTDTCLAALLRACGATDEYFSERHNYLRPEPLTMYLDKFAVTFQRNQYGRLGTFLLGHKASGDEIKAAFNAKMNGTSNLFTGAVGRPDRPIWLTPYSDNTESLCEEVEAGSVGPVRRAEIVQTIVSGLGLVDFDVGDELVAFVTKHQMGLLNFRHPVDRERELLPTGPTPIEAGGHRRFRNWPPAGAVAFGYGRTYALDKSERASCTAPGAHGLPEAVRPRMHIDDFVACISIGSLKQLAAGDSDTAYLQAIGAIAAVADLLRTLHKQFGI